MSYFSNTENRSTVEGLGCGPQCSCGPCKSGMSGIDEWYERDESTEAKAGSASTPPVQTRSATTLSEAPAARRVCNNRGIPIRTAKRKLTAERSNCMPGDAFTTKDPFDVLSTAIARALEMLDNTIGELVNGRNAVCAGATPAWPLFGDITLEWLRDRLGVCVDDIRVWTAGTFVNRSVAEVIRRLVRVRNLIGSNGLRYSCNSPGCEPGFWAFVIVQDAAGKCLPGTPQMLIRLCRNFWVPGVNTRNEQNESNSP